MELEQLASPVIVHRYAITPAERDRTDVQIRPQRTFAVESASARLVDRIPGMSIVVYSSYRLESQDVGVISEE